MGKVYKAIRFDSYGDMVKELRARKEKCEYLRKLAGNDINTTIRFGSMFYLESSKTVVGIDKTGGLMSVYVKSWADLMHILETREKDIYSIDDIVKIFYESMQDRYITRYANTSALNAEGLAEDSMKSFIKNSSNYNDCMTLTEMIEYYHGMIDCNEKNDFSDRPIIIRDQSMDEMFYIIRNGISGHTRALKSVVPVMADPRSVVTPAVQNFRDKYQY